MAIAVKSYLNFESGSPEIRRFSVPEDVGANFAYLVEKIQRTYPVLLRQEFQLFWRDQDDELIRFTSDEELVEALGNIQSDFFKVYIKATPSTSQDGKEPAQHPGVVCDVCDNGIVGTRYKCLVCPDYDLCSTCEGKGFHPEHEMLRIRTPRRYPFQGLLNFARGCPVGRGGRRGRCGRHRGGPWGPSVRPPHHGHHGPHGPFGHGGPHGPNRPPFVPPFDPRCFNGPWGSWGSSWAPSNEEKDKKEASENQSESVPPFFNALGEMISNFLQPFGIDVETYGENSQEPCECSGEPAADGERSQAEPTAPSEDRTTETSQAMEGEEEDGTSGQNEVTAHGNQDSPMAQGEDFVVVDKEKEKAKEQTAEPSRPYARVQEELFQKRLEEAIKAMQDMGFNNNGGWLTQLLISKDCDITRVLDTLHSQAQ